MKTAISLADDLFQAVDRLAEKDHLSRSEVFARAVKEYIERHRNAQILEALNQVYQEAEPQGERIVRNRGRRYYAAKVVKRENW